MLALIGKDNNPIGFSAKFLIWLDANRLIDYKKANMEQTLDGHQSSEQHSAMLI